jgi:hypothetical protein
MTATTNFHEVNNAFFDDFMNCISTEQTTQEDENSKICLISNEPLEEFAIRLKCGHSFNYSSLLNAIHQYKSDQYKISKKQDYDTYCPYCREKTEGLLPYAPNFEKIKNVNIPFNRSFGDNVCAHVMTNKKECGRKCYFKKCYLHIGTCEKIQCGAITKSGGQCKNKTTSVENYCKLHQK